MAVTNYYTVNGKIRGEGTAEDGYRPYGHDALGSVVATYDSTGSLENTYRNAPYGTQVAKTGTAADPRFLYNGGSGYRTTGRSYSPFYVRNRHLDNKSAQWITVDSLWPSQATYGYVQASPVTLTDPSGRSVYLCKRNLRTRDYEKGCWFNTQTPFEHWWIMMDDQSAPCKSIGYGPGGRYGHSDNLNQGYPSDISCSLLSSDPEVEACVCDKAAKVALGWVLCGSTWVDNHVCHTYNFADHNCQDYVICLMHSCGVGKNWYDQNRTWEEGQQGWDYWPPVVKLPKRR